MAAPSKLQLDRLKDLILRVGPEPLFAAPLVTPEDAWFPDRWSPDLECVRRILLRLAEYSGFADVDVEVAGFPEETVETGFPEAFIGQEPTKQTAALFLGIHEGCAWFGVEESQLQRPERLIGALAHEIARAWREVHEVHVTPPRDEEECTDLTSIVLGFGILVCNAAYEYHTSGEISGVLASTRWSHSTAGYIAVEEMAGLLACWALLKELPRSAIRKHLDVTQAAAFDAAWDRLAEIELFERLGIPAATQRALPVVKGASSRDFTPSHAARDAHECVKRLVELAGEEGGLLTEPVPFPVRVIALPHLVLATWGRVCAAGVWTRSLALVSDPEWDTQALVLFTRTWSELGRYALGHVLDRNARDGRHMEALLARLFGSGSAFRPLLAPSLPTHVTEVAGARILGDRQLETVFRSIADQTGADQVVSETEWLLQHQGHTIVRFDLERTQGGIPHVSSTGRADTKRWWQAVSDPVHVGDELSAVWVCAAFLRMRSGVEWNGPELPEPGSD